MKSFVPFFTLTGNLLAEQTLEFDRWSAGGTHRARTESFQVGGKGINVSKMLNRLGVPNVALCFAGGDTGARCGAWLQERGFTTQIFPTTAATRSGLVVRAPGVPETTFLGPDRAPDARAVYRCAAFLDEQPAGSVLALCGSFPGWTSADFDPLREALVRWLGRGHLVADTYGPPLAWAATKPLDLVKINATELATLGAAAETTVPLAARRYVVTDGPKPVRYGEPPHGEATVMPPVVAEVSATGSGDVLLACLLDALFRQRKSLREAVLFGLPYAAANAAHPAIAEFPNPA
jgi:fructose-1-phosphate kinase PfkB-like protein